MQYVGSAMIADCTSSKICCFSWSLIVLPFVVVVSLEHSTLHSAERLSNKILKFGISILSHSTRNAL